jgi:hypothetical protein
MLVLQRRLGIEPLQLALELCDVLELPVHGGEAHIGHRVELAQSAQCQLAHLLDAGSASA